MHKAMQRSVFESLLVTYGVDDFESAYADLADQAGEDVVKESLARNWMKAFDREQRQKEAGSQLARVSAGLDVATKATDFSKLERDRKLLSFDEHYLLFAHTVVSDHQGELFEQDARIKNLPKIAETLGTPIRLQQRRNSAQASHQAVPQVSSAFGTLTDRQVLTFYVREGMNEDYLTAFLRTLDADLHYLTVDTVRNKLREFERQGVQMDADGTLMGWDDAIAELRGQLRLVEQS